MKAIQHGRQRAEELHARKVELGTQTKEAGKPNLTIKTLKSQSLRIMGIMRGLISCISNKILCNLKS